MEEGKSQNWQGFILAVALFIASGFSSLIYQVVWTRMLVLVFGSTTFATSTVLAVFMGGLALGSFIAGRVSDRIKRPFLWYGILEGVIGIWALLVPSMFAAAIPLYRLVWIHMHPSFLPFSLLRCLMAALILIVPTACMGATLPLLSRFVISSLEKVGMKVGTLYSVNTLGAVAGATLSGFYLLPVLGLHATTWIAALINFGLCGIVLWFAPTLESSRIEPAKDKEQPVPGQLPFLIRLSMISFGISGAAAMIYEVGWTRTLLMVIGSSTYAFTIMLATFLVGIFLGSLICARFIDRVKQPIAWFGVFELLVCLFGLVSMFAFNYLPWWNLVVNAAFSHSPDASLAIRFLLASVVLLPLTLCLGAIFPAVVKVCACDLEGIGKSVGTLYSINTLGAIIGAIVAGFVLVPWLGVEHTLVLASAINLVLATVLLLTIEGIRPAVKLAVVVLAVPVLLWCLTMPELWDRAIMLTAQAERRFIIYSTWSQPGFEDWRKVIHDTQDTLFWKDGASSTVGITQYKNSHKRLLVTNGHVDASDGGDKNSQILLSGYPLLWKPDAKDVAIVGWGSGMSVGTASLFPVQAITAIELEPAVIDASKLFHHVNHQPELNPIVHLEFNDGRNYLLATDRTYDVIISEPSNPWQAGVCNLFTREYFQICQKRLKPGGIMAFWLQQVEIPPQNLKEILSALHGVFPFDMAIKMDSDDLAVLASAEPFKIDLARLRKTFQNKVICKELASVGVDSPESVIARIKLTPDGIAQLVRNSQPNVDDTNHLEYAVGKTYENRFFIDENDRLMDQYSGRPWNLIDFGQMHGDDKAKVMAEIARQCLLAGRTNGALSWSDASCRVVQNAEALRIAGIAKSLAGDQQSSDQLWQQALKLEPHNIEILQTAGLAKMQAGNLPVAREDLLKVLELEPGNPIAHFRLAQSYAELIPVQIMGYPKVVFVEVKNESKSPEKVMQYLESVLNDASFISNHHDALFLAAMAQYQLGHLSEAENLSKRYLSLRPRSSMACRLLGNILFQKGEDRLAAECWNSSFALASSAEAMLLKQLRQLIAAGKYDAAALALTRCLELCPGDNQAFSLLASLSSHSAKATESLKSNEELYSLLLDGKNLSGVIDSKSVSNRQ